jgi:hypothetical protein
MVYQDSVKLQLYKGNAKSFNYSLTSCFSGAYPLSPEKRFSLNFNESPTFLLPESQHLVDANGTPVLFVNLTAGWGQ